MRRDPRGLLWDACDSADAMMRFIAGRTLQDYLDERQLRSAVEREFEIIGESLNNLSRIAPDLAARIPALSRAVAFRNLLIHGYATVDNATVWRIAHEDLPSLRGAVAALLDAQGNSA